MNNIPAANLSQAFAITPLDGRNYHKIKSLSGYFSESALYRYRIRVEIEYFKKLSGWRIVKKLGTRELTALNDLSDRFGPEDYSEIKKLENNINHDVKAVEYYLKDRFEKLGLSELSSHIHLGLTSEDVNNLAYGLMLKDFNTEVAVGEADGLVSELLKLARRYKKIPMLARTHGQPAVATTVGKELANYALRLRKQSDKLKKFKFEGKMTGAVGNLNAQKLLLSKYDWVRMTREFVGGLGLTPNSYTTQILFYDNWMEFFQIVYLLNAILVDLSVNIWQSIMLSHFILKKKEGEVGSSTMPHKVNPINFEHAEGNLMMSNSMLEFFIRKLTSSRLQRDLSDSTVRRNFGEALGYSILGWRSILAGLGKISPNENFLKSELEDHWEILGEALQTALRLKNDSKAYEKLKSMTRGRIMDKAMFRNLINDLGLYEDKKIRDLTPDTYTGYAEELVDKLKI